MKNTAIQQEHEELLSNVPQNQIATIQTAIHKSLFLLELLQTTALETTIENKLSDYNTVNFYLKGYYCPYAKRMHKNNRSYFTYNSNSKTLIYKCFHPQFRETQITKGIACTVIAEMDNLSCLANINTQNSLHFCHDIINWNEKYRE
jgi:hypothetical protein